MLINVTASGISAGDLGHLLNKDPNRIHSKALAFGRAYLFFPHVDPQRCRATLFLDIDPVRLVRRKLANRDGKSADHFVNDRAYAASSYLSVALARLLGAAMSGRCRQNQALADMTLPLEATVTPLPFRGAAGMFSGLFAPLGYTVSTSFESDPTPRVGRLYATLTLTGEVRMRDLLTHLYVLVPVLDDQKHYWVGADEVDKLLARGKTWLAAHPEHELIARRYLAHHGGLTRYALSRLGGASLSTESQVSAPGNTAKYIADHESLEMPGGVKPRAGCDAGPKHTLKTRLRRTVVVRADQAARARDIWRRSTVDPHWLIYLPPTMSPTEPSNREGHLEHPEDAFAYFGRQRVSDVICQEKHMGSRAVIICCRDHDVARERFECDTEHIGAIYTRGGRPFFPAAGMTADVLDRLKAAADAADIWTCLESDWLCIDAEVMPWSLKAGGLIAQTYAPVGAAGRMGLAAAAESLRAAADRGLDVDHLIAKIAARAAGVARYEAAYRPYIRPVNGIDDLRIAPFHVLASEDRVHNDKPHGWHMSILKRLCDADQALLAATAHRRVNLDDRSSVSAAIEWWSSITEAGGEGIVVKPMSYVARGPKGLVQPAIKCRGRDYLRIVYGPEYDLPDNLARLRQRGLGVKRSLALREFALGDEALHRFTAREPLRKVHECVLAVLALETDPVDPRL